MTAGSELQPCDLDDGEHVTSIIQPETRQVAKPELACDQRHGVRERSECGTQRSPSARTYHGECSERRPVLQFGSCYVAPVRQIPPAQAS